MKNKKYHTDGTILKYHTDGTILKYHTDGTIPKYHTDGTILKTTLMEQFQNKISESQKEAKLIPPNTQIHDHPLSRLGTGTSIKVN